MTPKACIVDTNVIVSGLIGADSNSPPQGQLVTGDQLLLDNPPSGICVTSPRHFMDTFLSSKEN